MNLRRLLSIAAVAFAVVLVTTPEAEARRGWRRARWSSPRTVRTYQPRSVRTTSIWPRSQQSGPVTYSGVSRAEQEQQRRRDAWYNEAYNGWRPEDFR